MYAPMLISEYHDGNLVKTINLSLFFSVVLVQPRTQASIVCSNVVSLHSNIPLL